MTTFLKTIYFESSDAVTFRIFDRFCIYAIASFAAITKELFWTLLDC